MKKPVSKLLLAGAVPVFVHATQADVAAPASNPLRSTDFTSFATIREVIVAPCDTPTPPVWTLHSSNDGLHPDGNEQHAIWLMNRARQNPAVEGSWLATSDDPDIADGREFFNVDTELLTEEFSLIEPKPPAAPDCRLFEAAVSQSNHMIDMDEQTHDGQFERIVTSGFVYTHARGNVFSAAQSALNAHAAFNIDWANDPAEDPDDGMLDGRGHRKAVMSLDGAYTNVGLALVSLPDADVTENVGPDVVTGNYAHADETIADHFNTFITGTVWADDTGYARNDQYDPGEGISGAKVEIIEGTSGTGYTTAYTADGGGYAIPVTDGAYKVKFSEQGLTSHEVDVVVAGGKSVLLDFKAFLRSDCTNPNSIGDPYVVPADTVYTAGSETVICSDVSITANEGATIQGPDATENGAVVGFYSPNISITPAAEHQFTVENGAIFYTSSGP